MNDSIYIGAAILATVAAGVTISRRQCFDVPEGFYGLLYLHGRSLHRISPGRHWFWQQGYTVHLVDMRKTMLEVTAQVQTLDRGIVNVSAVMTYQIVQAETATHEVRDYAQHLRHAAQLAIRPVLGATPMEQLLQHPADIGRELLTRVTPTADKIGIVVHAMELKEFKLSAEPTLAARTTP